jgi:hypothetical protein
MVVLIAGFNLEMSLYKFKNIYCSHVAGENFKTVSKDKILIIIDLQNNVIHLIYLIMSCFNKI